MAKYNNRMYNRKVEGPAQSKFFDYKGTLNIEKYMEKDPYVAIELLDKYLEVYPDDYSSHEKLLSQLIKVGYYERAFEVLEYLESVVHDSKLKNIKDGKVQKIILQNIVFAKTRLYIHTGKYQEVYKYINDNVEFVNMNGLENIAALLFFLKCRLGLNDQIREEQKSYLFRQIVEYNEEEFIEHAKRHLEGYETDEEIDAIFYKDFPLEKVFEEVKKNYSIERRVSKGTINDEYYYRYDGCGTINGEICNYFKAVTLANDPEYITMCPILDYANYPCVDLNYLREDPKTKARKLSQIEKFNQRYGK